MYTLILDRRSFHWVSVRATPGWGRSGPLGTCGSSSFDGVRGFVWGVVEDDFEAKGSVVVKSEREDTPIPEGARGAVVERSWRLRVEVSEEAGLVGEVFGRAAIGSAGGGPGGGGGIGDVAEGDVPDTGGIAPVNNVEPSRHSGLAVCSFTSRGPFRTSGAGGLLSTSIASLSPGLGRLVAIGALLGLVSGVPAGGGPWLCVLGVPPAASSGSSVICTEGTLLSTREPFLVADDRDPFRVAGGGTARVGEVELDAGGGGKAQLAALKDFCHSSLENLVDMGGLCGFGGASVGSVVAAASGMSVGPAWLSNHNLLAGTRFNGLVGRRVCDLVCRDDEAGGGGGTKSLP